MARGRRVIESDDDEEFQDADDMRRTPPRRGGRHVANADDASSSASDGEGGVPTSPLRRSVAAKSTLFVIPQREDDLLMRNGNNYHVEYAAATEGEVKAALDEFDRRLLNHEWESLRDYFDYIFAVAKYNSSIEDWKMRRRVVNSLLQNWEMQRPTMSEVLSRTLAAPGQLPASQRASLQQHADALLMNVWLLYRMTAHCEKDVINKQRNAGQAKKGAAKKDAWREADEGDISSWIRNRNKIVDMLTEVCEMSEVDGDGRRRETAVKYLWRPAEADKGLVNTMIRLVCSLLENPEHTRASGRQWLGRIAKLIGCIAVRFDCYKMMAGLLVEKTVHLDYMRESTVSHYPFVEAIKEAGGNKGTLDPLLVQMIAYIGKLGPLEFSGKSSSPRPYALLIEAMAEKAPAVLIQHLTSIVFFLDHDPPIIRSHVLTAFCDLLLSEVLSPDRCRVSQRLNKARQNMLNKLQDHLLDQNALVRTKTVGLWTRLAAGERIPKERYTRGLIVAIGGRLTDKSVQVRKAAVAFMATFLTKNPYGHDFSIDNNVEQLEALLKKRDEEKKKNPAHRGVHAAMTQFQSNEAAIREGIERALRREEKHAREEKEGEDGGDANRSAADLDDTGKTNGEGEDEDEEAAAAARKKRKRAAKRNESVRKELEMEIDDLLEIVYENVVQPEMCRMACEVFVRAVLKGRVLGVEIEKSFSMESRVHYVVESLRDAYVKYTVANQLIDDKQCLESEERVEDWQVKMEQLDRSITFMKEKCILEMDLEECVPKALRGVIQGDMSEMKEGIKFVVECKNFMIKGADKAVRTLCSLIWRNNESIRTEVLKAAEQMFVSQHRDKRIQQQSTVKNLLDVLDGMDDTQRSCVEEVICRMASGQPLGEGAVRLVWEEMAKGGSRETSAIRLLSILARTDSDGLRQRLRGFQKLIRDRVKAYARGVDGDSRTAVESLAAIAQLASRPRKALDANPAFRIPAEDSLFVNIQQFLVYELLSVSSPHWFTAMRAALGVCFDVAKDTCAVLGMIVGKLSSVAVQVNDVVFCYEVLCEKATSSGSLANGEKDKLRMLRQRRLHWRRVWLVVMERLVALTGEMAVKVLVHSDVTFVREVLRMGEVLMTTKAKQRPFDCASVLGSRPLREWERRSALGRGIFDFVDSNSDRLGLNGITEEERVRQRARRVQETVFTKDRLLARLLPLVTFSLRAQGAPDRLRDAAMCAFAKICVASEEVSRAGGWLVLAGAVAWPRALTRNNLLACVTDLASRNTTLVSDHAVNVFNAMRDRDPTVRESALLVLSHLVNNDLLQVNGLISPIAHCYLDRVPTVANLARILLKEMSRSEKTTGSLNNAFIDIVSRLTYNQKELSLDNFKQVIGYMVNLLTEKQRDALAEKMCTRFEYTLSEEYTSKNPDLAAYYSACLSFLPLGEKAFYKVRDLLGSYKHSLTDERVYMDFCSLLAPLSKTAKAEIKGDVEDFEKKLLDIHTKGMDAKQREERAGMWGRAHRAMRGRGAARGGRKRRATHTTTNSDSD